MPAPTTAPTTDRRSRPDAASAHPRGAADGRPRRGFLPALERPAEALRHFAPNWFTSVMGTAIVGVSAVKLPLIAPWLQLPATVVWGLAVLLLVVVIAMTIGHWVRHAGIARRELTHPVMANFTGAVSMALVAVAAGWLPLGAPIVGDGAAAALAWALWLSGTLIGIASAVLVPVLLFVRHRHGADAAFAGWLMPIVPPMVSSAVGIGLVGTLDGLEAQRTLLVVCASLFGTTIFPALFVMALVWHRLLRFGVGPAQRVPMLAIVLGPLGQSATSAIAIGAAAEALVPAPLGAPLHALGIAYAAVVLGFALLWFAITAVLVARQVRIGLPFSLAWWSFTFPVGTCVTGFSALAHETGLTASAAIAIAIWVVLVAAWLVVLSRTLHGALVTGVLLLPPVPGRTAR